MSHAVHIRLELLTAGKAKNEMPSKENPADRSRPVQVCGVLSPYPIVVSVIWRKMWEYEGSNFLYVYKTRVILLKTLHRHFTFTFTFMHLADAFIQSDLQCIQAIHFFCKHLVRQTALNYVSGCRTAVYFNTPHITFTHVWRRNSNLYTLWLHLHDAQT